MRWILLILALAVCGPTPASAVTLDEVVALSRSGVSDQVILALIERDQTLFSMSPDLLVKLHRERLSDTILLAILKSGRPADTSIAASAAMSTAPAAVVSPPLPAFVIVGHGPERPNTLYDAPLLPESFVVPVPVPYLIPHVARRPPRRVEPAPQPFCVSTTHTGFVPSALTSITDCPASPPAPR